MGWGSILSLVGGGGVGQQSHNHTIHGGRRVARLVVPMVGKSNIETCTLYSMKLCIYLLTSDSNREHGRENLKEGGGKSNTN